MIDAERVLVWTPWGRDSSLACELLRRHAISSTTMRDVDELCGAMTSASCAIIASEALTEAARATLVACLEQQPAWSDFPILLLAPPGAPPGRTADALHVSRLLGNVTLLDRPMRARTLLSSVEAARRARRRQYEAREAIHRRDQFLAMLGHELRNPLAAVVLAVESLDLLESEHGLKQRRIIDRQARHLVRLVDDLLDVARVTTGKVTLQLGDVDLGEIVQRCVQGAELAARERSILLRFDGPAESLTVRGDAVRLEEVFNNLITNALKYSPDGSRVDVTARCSRDECVVEIHDTGVGISPDMLPRVFDLFTQVESSLARSQGGLGIGLTLVRSLVELHNGKVEARSPGVGHGSTFIVHLPRTTAAVAPRLLATVPAVVAIRVVLVDDNLDILEMTAELLEHRGCEVHVAADGPSGLVAISAHAPDVAIVDIGLPGMDGYQLARQVRQLPLARQPYLVALTGYGQSSDRDRALEAGFDEHLIKPITIERLQKLFETYQQAGRRTAAGSRGATRELR